MKLGAGYGDTVNTITPASLVTGRGAEGVGPGWVASSARLSTARGRGSAWRAPPRTPRSARTMEVMMGEGNAVASVIMLTFTKMPGPHADTAWAVVG